MWFIWGCAPIIESFDGTPETITSATEAITPQVLLEGFVEPYGLSAVSDGFLLSDAGTGELWHWSPDNDTLTIEHEGLGQPTALVTDENDSLIFDAENQRLLHFYSGELVVLSEGISNIGELLIHQGSGFVTIPEAGELLHVNFSTSTVTTLLDGLPSPVGLAASGDDLWFSTQDDQAIWSHTISTGETAQVLTLEEVPYGLDDDGSQLLIASRSTRWPYGGWVYSYTSTLAKLTDSPPEANDILALNSGVIWTSKQSVTYLPNDAETYVSVGIQTAVGQILTLNDAVYWTDRQSGRLYFAELP